MSVCHKVGSLGHVRGRAGYNLRNDTLHKCHAAEVPSVQLNKFALGTSSTSVVHLARTRCVQRKSRHLHGTLII